jgi:hypothetical protein
MMIIAAGKGAQADKGYRNEGCDLVFHFDVNDVVKVNAGNTAFL